MTDASLRLRRTGFAGVLAALITLWALLGGAVLLLVAAMNVASVVGGMAGHPFPGDFEMTEVGIAVAAFAFLPYCQLTDANVTADIFTAGLSRRAVAVLKMVYSVVALLFGLLLLTRMYAGMQDQRDYGYSTTILQFPVWTAYAAIIASLALLVVAAALTVVEDWRAGVLGWRRGD
ncbi:MAG: hypothetical protein AcusKO_37710 [Acuticoccus sp.]